ncbi:MAG: GAF domain-containing protein [Verrucomicrobiota bacterium]|nr:GAF domain-containing protein [Verrucomicrobiota bacterium]
MPVKKKAVRRAKRAVKKAPRKLDAKCRTLQEIGVTMIAGGRGHDVLQEIAEMVQTRCHYRWIGIYKIKRHEFVIEAATGKTCPAYPRFPVTQGITAEAVEKQKTLIVRDVKKDKRFLPNFWTTRSEIIVPIIDDEHEKVAGVINVESAKLNAFGKEDRDFLEGVARLVWRALR